MLRFSRSALRGLVRGESVRGYLRYAIGEIFLVVIGILIALQINNWNEDRLERKREREFLDSMLTDLREDVGTIDGAVRGNGFLVDQIGDLLELLEKPLDDPRAQREMFVRSVAYTYWYIRVEFSELTMAQLKSSGGLRLIEDPEVRRAMLRYEQGVAVCKYQYTLIESYFHTYETSQKRVLNMKLARRAFAHIDENYLNMLEPIEAFEPLVPEAQYLIDDDPKLLAIYFTDLFFYRSALNQAVRFLAQQEAMAKSLIDLIQSRYGID